MKTKTKKLPRKGSFFMYGKNMNRTLAFFPKNLIPIVTNRTCIFPKLKVKKHKKVRPQIDM